MIAMLRCGLTMGCQMRLYPLGAVVELTLRVGVEIVFVGEGCAEPSVAALLPTSVQPLYLNPQ